MNDPHLDILVPAPQLPGTAGITGGRWAGDSSALSLPASPLGLAEVKVGRLQTGINMRQDKNLPVCVVCAGEGAASADCHFCCAGCPA